MKKERFIISQHGNFHMVIDTVEEKQLGVFEFKENEFPVYACFHHIIDTLNELTEENERLKTHLSQLAKCNREGVKKIQKLAKENRQLKNRNCGKCKYLQLDGMFGMWCEKDRDWTNTDANDCPDYAE